MKILIRLLLAFAITISAAHAAEELYKLLPPSEVASGWKMEFEPEIYDPDNLFEYINGEAELYNDYKFVQMITSSYASAEDPSQTITVDIYDMGTPLQAFGIYSSYRRPDLRFAYIGEEATVSDLNVRLYKGRHFVQVNAGSMEDAVRALIRKVAQQVADKVPAAEPAEELGMLPPKNQLAHSLKYVRDGFWGQAAFQSGFEAVYHTANDTLQAFVVLLEDNDQSASAFDTFAASLKSRGEAEIKQGVLVASSPYRGRITARTCGKYIIGAAGYKLQDQADRLLKQIEENLTK